MRVRVRGVDGNDGRLLVWDPEQGFLNLRPDQSDDARLEQLGQKLAEVFSTVRRQTSWKAGTALSGRVAVWAGQDLRARVAGDPDPLATPYLMDVEFFPDEVDTESG